MKRQSNPFAKYQATRVTARAKLVDTFLRSLERSRVKFKYVTDLAEMVASHISLIEGRPCAKSTLLRNKRYKAFLLHFMAISNGVTSFDKMSSGADRSIQASELLTKLSDSNKSHEIARLRAYIEVLQKERSINGGREAEQKIASESLSSAETALDELRFKHAMTCKALQVLVTYFEGVVAANTDKGEIIDLSKRRNNVIVEATLGAPFFDWLRSQRFK